MTMYRIYLLTVWQHTDSAHPNPLADEQPQQAARGDMTWRFALEDPRTGQRRGFVSLVELLAALQAEFPDQRPNADSQ